MKKLSLKDLKLIYFILSRLKEIDEELHYLNEIRCMRDLDNEETEIVNKLESEATELLNELSYYFDIEHDFNGDPRSGAIIIRDNFERFYF